MSDSLPKLSDPPRRIPRGLELRVLEEEGISASLWATLPAAAMLLFSMLADIPHGARATIMVFVAGLLVCAFTIALRGLARAKKRLRRMRRGLLTVGRIRTCRAFWEGSSADVKYEEFLRDFASHLRRSMARKAIGCAITLFTLPLAIGIALMIIVFAIVLAARAMGFAVNAADDVTFSYWVKFTLAALLFWCGYYVTYRFVRWWHIESFEAEIEHERTQLEGDYPQRLMRDAKDPAARIALRDPLPHGRGGVLLDCKVEYWSRNELRHARGRAFLCDELNLAGVEALILDPAQPEEVELVVGFPEWMRVAAGEWVDVPGPGSAARLAISNAVIIATLIGFAAELARMMLGG